MSYEAWGTPPDPEPQFCPICDLESHHPGCELGKMQSRAQEAERDAERLRNALTGLHQVCEIALAGKDGKQFSYFETRAGHFVSAVEAMQQAETALAARKDV